VALSAYLLFYAGHLVGQSWPMISQETAHVRAYQPADAAAVMALAPRLAEGVAPWRASSAIRAVVTAWVADAISRGGDDETVLVAEAGGTVVGFVGVRTRKHWSGMSDAYVGELVVHQAHEGTGVGRALMSAAIAWATERGLATVTLETGAANARARAFYARLGFLEEEVRLTLPLKQ
jgi:ribosomal protein S18 acetylase RimI-like enzyme